MSTIVVMPGGFHPFHAGHAALYNSARRAFPDAEVFVAATNDTSTRPFPFAVKEKLAKLAGVEPGHFVQVKSPFRAEEITSQFNPDVDSLIFVRSEKDKTKPPQAGGNKKDGSPAYLQPLLSAKRLEPFGKHAYMAYLPTVEFGPGMTSATEIRTAWPTLNEKRKTALVMSLYPKTQTNPRLAATVVKLLDTAMGSEQGVAEAVAPSQYAKLYHSTPLMSLDAILQSGYLAPTTKGYLSLTRDSKLDYGSWGGEFVEFDLDQNAVRQRIKLEPYVDPTTQTGARAAGRGESEERTKQKIPLKGFVTAMHAPTGWEGDKAGEYYGGLLKKYGVPIVYDIVPTLEEQGMAEMDGQNFVGGMTASYQERENQPIDEDYIDEKWSQKYKSSINCANPKGFSQRAHCAGRKK
jgi:hypothetical protein